jgi:hypothetical protein
MFSLLSLNNKNTQAYRMTIDQIPYEKIIKLNPVSKKLLEAKEKKEGKRFRKRKNIISALSKNLYLFIIRKKTSDWENNPLLNKNCKYHQILAEDYEDWNIIMQGVVTVFKSPQYYQRGKFPKHWEEKFSGSTNEPLCFTALRTFWDQNISYRDQMAAIEILEDYGLIHLESEGYTRFSLDKEKAQEMFSYSSDRDNYFLSQEDQAVCLN